MTASVTHGVTMSPITAFSPRKGLHCINQEKITCFHGVPTMFIAMLGHENFPKTDFLALPHQDDGRGYREDAYA